MGNLTFSPEQLETIQLKVMGLLFYVKKHDSRTLPDCFRFCERIVRNIDICRIGCYVDIDELTQLIKEDWRMASHFRVGMPEYYIPNDEIKIRKSMNKALSIQILDIGEHINAQ